MTKTTKVQKRLGESVGGKRENGRTSKQLFTKCRRETRTKRHAAHQTTSRPASTRPSKQKKRRHSVAQQHPRRRPHCSSLLPRPRLEKTEGKNRKGIQEGNVGRRALRRPPWDNRGRKGRCREKGSIGEVLVGEFRRGPLCGGRRCEDEGLFTEDSAQFPQAVLHFGHSCKLCLEALLLIVEGKPRRCVQRFQAPAALTIELEQV